MARRPHYPHPADSRVALHAWILGLIVGFLIGTLVGALLVLGVGGG